MGIFESFRRRAAAHRLWEERLYEQVVAELAHGTKRDGLWAKSLAHAGGNPEMAKSLYVRYRVQSLKDELNVARAMEESKAREAPSSRIRQCTDRLRMKGYRVIETRGGWEVIDPITGLVKLGNIEDFERHAEAAASVDELRLRAARCISLLEERGFRVTPTYHGWHIAVPCGGSCEIESMEALERYAASHGA